MDHCHKLDREKTQAGFDVAIVTSNDSVYVQPGDTIIMRIMIFNL